MTFKFVRNLKKIEGWVGIASRSSGIPAGRRQRCRPPQAWWPALGSAERGGASGIVDPVGSALRCGWRGGRTSRYPSTAPHATAQDGLHAGRE